MAVEHHFEGPLAPQLRLTEGFGRSRKDFLQGRRIEARLRFRADGRIGVFPTGGADPGTRSAPIVNGSRFSSMVVADISTNGEISFTPSIASKVRIDVVGFVRP
jgi:hypothetical protein